MKMKIRQLIIFITSTFLSVSISTQLACHHDFSEQMFQSDIVVSAKVKAVFRSRQTENVKYRLSVSRVYKDLTNTIKPKQKVTILKSSTGLGCNKTTSVKVNRKYLFTLSTANKNLELVGGEEKLSRRNKKIIKNLICNGCGRGPKIKKTSRKSSSVKMYRWKGLKCRLDTETEPTVKFSWIHNNRTVTVSDNYKIRSKRRGSVLNIRGLPETAGVYTCLAHSLAGSDQEETTLYVHGSVDSVCSPRAG